MINAGFAKFDFPVGETARSAEGGSDFRLEAVVGQVELEAETDPADEVAAGLGVTVATVNSGPWSTRSARRARVLTSTRSLGWKVTERDGARVTAVPATIAATASEPLAYNQPNRAVASVPPSRTSIRSSPSGSWVRGSSGGAQGSRLTRAALRTTSSRPVLRAAGKVAPWNLLETSSEELDKSYRTIAVYVSPTSAA